MRLATPPMMPGLDDAGGDRRNGDQVHRPWHAPKLHRSEGQGRERDDVAEWDEYDPRDREYEDDPEPDQNIDRAGGDPVDGENEADVWCHVLYRQRRASRLQWRDNKIIASDPLQAHNIRVSMIGMVRHGECR